MIPLFSIIPVNLSTPLSFIFVPSLRISLLWLILSKNFDRAISTMYSLPERTISRAFLTACCWFFRKSSYGLLMDSLLHLSLLQFIISFKYRLYQILECTRLGEGLNFLRFRELFFMYIQKIISLVRNENLSEK